MHDISIPIPLQTSIWQGGEETKVIVQETARDATSTMRLIASDVYEVKSS